MQIHSGHTRTRLPNVSVTWYDADMHVRHTCGKWVLCVWPSCVSFLFAIAYSDDISSWLTNARPNVNNTAPLTMDIAYLWKKELWPAHTIARLDNAKISKCLLTTYNQLRKMPNRVVFLAMTICRYKHTHAIAVYLQLCPDKPKIVIRALKALLGELSYNPFDKISFFRIFHIILRRLSIGANSPSYIRFGRLKIVQFRSLKK